MDLIEMVPLVNGFDRKKRQNVGQEPCRKIPGKQRH